MRRQDDATGEYPEPASDPGVTSQANMSWRTVLLVLVVLLVGAVVGHGLLTDGGRAGNGLAGGAGPGCNGCPSSVTCLAGKTAPAVEQGAAVVGSAVSGCPSGGMCLASQAALAAKQGTAPCSGDGTCCPGGQAGCLFANPACSPGPGCCATNAPDSENAEARQALPCCPSSTGQ